MNALVFYSNKNTPGRKDATGAFIPEAVAFTLLHGIPDTRLIGINCINTTKAARRNKVFSEIKLQHDLDCIAFFCHGWSSGIQFGINFRNVIDLAYELSRTRDDNTRAASSDLTVCLYACSTADGPDIDNENYPDDDQFGTPAPGTDGGFADQLRDSLCSLGLVKCRVVAHATAGHCTRNPYVVFFDGDGTPEGVDEDSYEGGKWVYDPKDIMWHKWRLALKTDFRFRMPFMQLNEIEEKLQMTREA